MKRLKKGNVLLGCMDDELALAMELYFKRKNCNVFVAMSNDEIKRIIKYNGISIVLFGLQQTPDYRLQTAQMISDFDSQICIFFICEDRSQKDMFITANEEFSCIVKPFAMRNLYQKMFNIVNQRNEQQDIFSSFKIGSYVFNLHKQSLLHAITEQERHLTKKEALLLKNLCQHKNKYVPKHRLLLNIWQKDDYNSSRSMDVYITKLRKYLSEDSNISIDNKHSVGYKILINE